VDYIIDEIPSEVLRNQARMHSFLSVQEIMQAFNKLNLNSEQGATNWNAHRKQESGQSVGKNKEATTKNQV